MRFAWVGLHAEGIPALEALLECDAPIRAVVTLKGELAAKRSGALDYRPVCQRYGVPLHHTANVNDPDIVQLFTALAPDIVFVIGWHQIVRPETLRLASVGMIGAHASLLPRNRGSAPINWALIRGEPVTGNTLIWLADDLDAGDIIDQTAFPITPYDTCASLYERVAASNREMLLRALPHLLAGERPGRPQPKSDDPVLPRRRPADGLIDWSQPAAKVYDFIRALARPYPGAFSSLDNRRWWIWQAALPPGDHAGSGYAAGEVIGPVVSPVSQGCGQLVACGSGAIILLELQSGDGEPLKGPALSEHPWTGKRWR